jgi:large subunit ribosomal protein L22
MIYRAKHRYADVSPRKMRPLAQLVRGKNVDEALEQLRFYPNRGARLIEAVIKSAIGNAEDQGSRNVEDLVVTECRIDGGPMFKRIRPRARGTAFGIKRRLAHIVVAVTDMEALEAATAAPATTSVTPTPAPTSPPTPATTPA